MIPMTDYEECRRYVVAFVNVSRNLEFLRLGWMREFGITETVLLERARDRVRAPVHEFPPPQPNAETCARGKLRGYRQNYLRRGGDLAALEAAWAKAIDEAMATYREGRDGH